MTKNCLNISRFLISLLLFTEIEIAEPDYIVGVNNIPNDPSYLDQWHHPIISSPLGWDLATGSRQIKVCVIDSGVRIDHPDVIDNVLGGWNLVPNGPQDPTPTEGDPAWYNFNDTLGHGTHVSGLIAAMGNNARGVSGAAWRIGIVSCKFISDAGSGYVSDAITCMQLCQAEGAVILSNSWGGMQTPSNALLSQIQSVGSAGILFVAAAGNNKVNVDASPVYPAGYQVENLVAVAATTQSDTLADFSNYGANTIHLAAPGVNLLSTTHDNLYGYMSGTSMAAPLVSGAAALLQAMSLEATNTYLTPLALRQLLVDSVDPIPGGNATLISGGRLNLGRAVQTLAQQLGTRYKQSTAPEVPPPTLSPLPQIAIPTTTEATQPPASSPTNVSTQLVAPECGTSIFRGALAEQSSTYLGRIAAYAVNGDCRNDPILFSTACASTDPQDDYPWWQGQVANNTVLEINAASITTRADCCWNAIAGAQVFVGFGYWNSTSQNNTNNKNFVSCGEVPVTGVARGQRINVACTKPMNGTTVVVFLPKLQTSLTLCEVDLTISNQIR